MSDRNAAPQQRMLLGRESLAEPARESILRTINFRNLLVRSDLRIQTGSIAYGGEYSKITSDVPIDRDDRDKTGTACCGDSPLAVARSRMRPRTFFPLREASLDVVPLFAVRVEPTCYAALAKQAA